MGIILAGIGNRVIVADDGLIDIAVNRYMLRYSLLLSFLGSPAPGPKMIYEVSIFFEKNFIHNIEMPNFRAMFHL